MTSYRTGTFTGTGVYAVPEEPTEAQLQLTLEEWLTALQMAGYAPVASPERRKMFEAVHAMCGGAILAGHAFLARGAAIKATDRVMDASGGWPQADLLAGRLCLGEVPILRPR